LFILGFALVCAGLFFAISARAQGQKFGLGRIALAEEIAAWDLDIPPDGTGLPMGSGSVETGEVVFSDNCAVCHGDFAEGIGNWPVLAGGQGTLDHQDPVKTVGSFWPYLTTVLDYVRRSKPYGNAQSLTNDQLYAIVAYLLYSNDLVEDDFVLSNDNLLTVEMPNADGFVVDDRPQTEYPQFSGEPCMADCKSAPARITMRATALDVTPDDQATLQAAEHAQPTGDVSLELAARGKKLFKKCKACHQIGAGAKNQSGPVLNGIVGNAAGSVEGFKYSSAMKMVADGGLIWTPEQLAAFLAMPKTYLKGTKMSFAGLETPRDAEAMIEFLRTFEN